jgi:catechol 2,3-dioxygenase-like lactoylglutathione lyase family enzyme
MTEPHAEDPTTTQRPGITRFVHIGLVVEDLGEMSRFLETLGLTCSEPATYGGEWIERIVGISDPQVEVVMAQAPDGDDVFELVRFVSPRGAPPAGVPAANTPGLRHVAFQVDDLHGLIDRLRAGGWETVGEIVNYQDVYLLCYARGPEGLIVELAEPLRSEGA